MGWIFAFLLVGGILLFCFLPQLKGWRTQIFASITAVGGGLLPLMGDIFTYLDGLDWRQYLKPEHAPWMILAIGIIVLILRKLTTGPVGTKH